MSMPFRPSSAGAWRLVFALGLAAPCGLAIRAAAQAPPRQGAAAAGAVPRTADGKPNLQGIWQVRNRAAYDLQDHAAKDGMPAGMSVIEGGEIPYQQWAA